VGFPDQTELIETLDELGLETYERHREGESVYVSRDGLARRFTGDIFPAGKVTEAEITRLIGLLDGLVAELDLQAPWEHPQAAEFDRISYRAWWESQSTDAEAIDNISAL